MHKNLGSVGVERNLKRKKYNVNLWKSGRLISVKRELNSFLNFSEGLEEKHISQHDHEAPNHFASLPYLIFRHYPSCWFFPASLLCLMRATPPPPFANLFHFRNSHLLAILI